MVIKQSLELGVFVESSQEKDVQNPRQKGKVKGRGRGPRQFGEACMTVFHVAGAVGDRDTKCHCSIPLGRDQHKAQICMILPITKIGP